MENKIELSGIEKKEIPVIDVSTLIIKIEIPDIKP